MKYLLPLCLLLCGCDLESCMKSNHDTTQEHVKYDVVTWHDDKRGVTCFITATGPSYGISCLPDIQLKFNGDK